MLDTIKEVAHNYFQGARGSHSWDHTKAGLKLADERHAFMEEFFNRFIEENEGKR